jgi:aminopeptidase-like protein
MDLVARLTSIPRSIVSEGNEKTLEILSQETPHGLEYIRIPSGTSVNGWRVPDSWNVRSASLTDPSGNEYLDYDSNKLCVVIGSLSCDTTLTHQELLTVVHTAPDLPDATPYVTNYYSDGLGICLPQRVVDHLAEGPYSLRLNIDIYPGDMILAEHVFSGQSERELVFSTYNCHPQMANNELSGPALWVALQQILALRQELGPLAKTYRFYIGPETIGAIHYLAVKGRDWPRRVDGNYILTCQGVDKELVRMPSVTGASYVDRLSLAAQEDLGVDLEDSSFRQRGSDERQFASPAVGMATNSVMTAKYHDYPEYHTSADDLDLVSDQGFLRSLEFFDRVIELHEGNWTPLNFSVGEPKLDRFGLYPPQVNHAANSSPLTDRRALLDILAYADGSRDLLEIASLLEAKPSDVQARANILENVGLLTRSPA